MPKTRRATKPAAGRSLGGRRRLVDQTVGRRRQSADQAGRSIKQEQAGRSIKQEQTGGRPVDRQSAFCLSRNADQGL